MENRKMDELNKELSNTVKVKIVSSRGHDEFESSPTMVLDKIKEETKDNKKWLYLDGAQSNPDSISIDDLIEASDVTLTNALVGG